MIDDPQVPAPRPALAESTNQHTLHFNDLNPDRAQRALIVANRRKQAGFDVDSELRQRYGIGYNDLLQMVRGHKFEAPASAGRDVARGVATVGQGAALGWLPELVGQMARVGPANAPAAPIEDAVRRELDAFKDEHPLAAPALEMGGAALVPGAAQARAVREMAPAARAATGILGGTGMGAAAGAGFDPNHDPVSALKGAAIGLPLAALGEVLSSATASTIDEMLGRLNPVRQGRILAERQVRELAQRSGIGVDEARQRLAEMEAARPGLGVGGDLSTQFRRGIRDAVNQGSGNIDEVLDQVRGRMAGDRTVTTGVRGRLASDLTRLGGADADAASKVIGTDWNPGTAEKLRTNVGRQVYAPFNGQEVPISPELKGLLKNSEVQPLWNRVRPLEDKGGVQMVGGHHGPTMSAFDQKVNQILSALGGSDEPSVRAAAERSVAKAHPELATAQPTTFEHIQDLSGRLRDAADAAKVRGEGQLARRLYGYQSQLDDIMERTPGFEGLASANRAYAQASSVKRAFEMGSASNPLRDDVVQRELGQVAQSAGPYAPHAVDAYRSGQMQNAINMVLDTRNPSADVGRAFASISRNLFPTPEAADEWMRNALIEGKFHDMLSAVSGNSTTMQQGADAIRFGRIRNMLAQGLDQIGGQRNEARANAFLKLMLGRGPVAHEDVLRVLGQTLPPSTAAMGASLGAAAGVPFNIDDILKSFQPEPQQ